MKLSVIILTKNEELHLARAINHLRSLTIPYEVFVVDSFSTDRTHEIARSLGAEVVLHDFVNHAQQFQWALDHLPLRGTWVMRLDADEVISPQLAEEMSQAIATAELDVTAFTFDRRHIFQGHWVRHGGRFPVRLLRVWRRGLGRIEQRWMDEHIIVDSGRVVTLKGAFEDRNLNDLTFFTAKHNAYATREAVDVLIRKYQLPVLQETIMTGGGSRQASRKRWLKERVYNRLPYPIAVSGYFIWRLVFQRGFLDGASGILYHFLQGFWYRLLVGAKVNEFDRQMRQIEGPEDLVDALSNLSGYRLKTTLSDNRPRGRSEVE